MDQLHKPQFLSTLSLRRATFATTSAKTRQSDFYPRSPCGERPYLLGKFWDLVGISIHALLAESDQSLRVSISGSPSFLSTLSLRRATNYYTLLVHQNQISIHALLAESDSNSKKRDRSIYYFYPRSPCGERLLFPLPPDTTTGISIHALLAESDFWPMLNTCSAQTFLSTLSLRRATIINVPRESWSVNFYPRSPCGERPEIYRRL